MEKINRIGIYNKEIFIETQDGCTHVLRIVPADRLKDLQSVEGLKKYGFDDDWRNAVYAGHTELGLDDWLEELLDDIDGDEDFPCKDNSYVDDLPQDVREKADEFIYDTYGIEVGTWECSGIYSPDGEYDIILL